MSRLPDSPQLVITSSRGDGANLLSHDVLGQLDLWSVMSRRRGVIATILLASILGAFGVSWFSSPRPMNRRRPCCRSWTPKKAGVLLRY